jgi:hypothetical protein
MTFLVFYCVENRNEYGFFQVIEVRWWIHIKSRIFTYLPYHVENTGSRPITEIDRLGTPHAVGTSFEA